MRRNRFLNTPRRLLSVAIFSFLIFFRALRLCLSHEQAER